MHGIAQAFLLDRCVYPGTQQGGIERLRQVIHRAELDATNDAVELVERRDDDDRQLVQAVGGVEALKHLVAVADRHHDVEQDKIEGVICDQFEGCLAVGSDLGVVVALALQAADQQVAVVLDVVYDKDARRLPRDVFAGGGTSGFGGDWCSSCDFGRVGLQQSNARVPLSPLAGTPPAAACAPLALPPIDRRIQLANAIVQGSAACLSWSSPSADRTASCNAGRAGLASPA